MAETPAEPTPEFFAGLDLGQAHDFTALAVLERSWHGEEGARVARFDVRHLERVRGAPYPDVVELVRARIAAARPRSRAAALVVDKTGVGAPVVDMVRRAGLRCRVAAVTITAGDAVAWEGDEYRVPKRDVVSTLAVLLQSGRLRVARALPEAATFAREATNFRARISAAGRDSYGAGGAGDGWREGPHDDLLLAVGLAAWYAAEAPKPPVVPWVPGFGVKPRWGVG